MKQELYIENLTELDDIYHKMLDLIGNSSLNLLSIIALLEKVKFELLFADKDDDREEI